MPEKAVSFSGKKLKAKCENCNADQQEIVQSQKYIGVGSLRLWGLGPRELKSQCIGCDELYELTDAQSKKAKKLRYAEDRNQQGKTLLASKAKNKKYPVLNQKRREKIRKENRKEGLLSMAIGVVIGLIILPLPFQPWALYLGLIIIGYSILGGLYGIFEDPERRHRHLLDEDKKGIKLR